MLGEARVTDVLAAPHVLEYTYTRSTGPVLGRFLTELREGRIVGIRGADGQVLVPPQEYDPQTSQALDEFVEVGTSGEVVSWSWNPTPRHGQPLDRPFAWALVKLDGADTPILHAVDAGSPDALSAGTRVTAVFRDEPLGRITDLAYFALEGGA